VQILEKDDTSVLNVCAKYLARTDLSPRHNFGQFQATDHRARISEAWRFPIIDSYSDGVDQAASYAFNEVTFVHGLPWLPPPNAVGIVGTFASLHEPIPLRRIAATPFFTCTLKIPKGEVHTYKFIVDGVPTPDPINPQRVTLENGREWSRFFTHLCSQPVSFERWELALLDRLTTHILPFRTVEGENFLERFYFGADKASKDTQYAHAYRLDQPVGVVNFIDKLLAREESHHLLDYKICLGEIDRVLRARNPVVEPWKASRELFVELYDQMWAGAVGGWNDANYGNPRYFLQLLRRHTFTGAFSHPKYGGNAGAAGWAYLEERFREADGGTAFDWRRITEQPLGSEPIYRG
jgi:Gluconate 2-dehydrogenase subunit 3/Glycogen recognition site of AMP-activated protein kinase